MGILHHCAAQCTGHFGIVFEIKDDYLILPFGGVMNAELLLHLHMYIFILLAESLNIMTGLKKEDLLSDFENGKCLSYKFGILEAF